MTLVYVIVAPREFPHPKSIASLHAACDVAGKKGIGIILAEILGGAPGAHTANGATAMFIRQKDATHMFLGADDILYPDNILLKLLDDDKDVVGGVYRKRTLLKMQPANWSSSTEEFYRKLKEKGVYPTEYSAAHTMLIKRKVVEGIIAKYPEIEYVDPESGQLEWGAWTPFVKDRHFHHDDWAFSVRAKECGFQLWDDYSVVAKHYCADFLGFEEELDGN
jgi:hypothetical protein